MDLHGARERQRNLPASGFVQFSLGAGITTVPVKNGVASFTAPSDLDAGDYTITASYTGDPNDAASSDSADLTVAPAPTALTLSGPTSTAFGVADTITATVACAPSCGTTPIGYVDFSLNGNDTDVDLVGGQATFTTDPTIAPGLANEVDATFWSFDDDNGPNAWSDGAPVDFSPSAKAEVFYDIGSVNLAVETGDGTATNGTTPVDDGGAVTVNPSANAEISAQLTAVNAGSGTPPGPVTIDVVFGSSDVTAQLGLSNASEAAPTEDAETGEPDYFWALPAMALSRLASSGTATVTVGTAGTDDFVPAAVTFSLEW